MINVEFVGRLGADTEEKVSLKGNKFLSFRVATDDFTSNGEKTTTWVRVVYHGDRAIRMKEWLTKGKLVQVHGPLRASAFTNKNGEPQASLDVIADRVDFISVGPSKENDSHKEEANEAMNVEVPKAETEAPAPTVTTAAASKADVKVNFEDDLPF